MGHHLKPGSGHGSIAERVARTRQTETMRDVTDGNPGRHVWVQTGTGEVAGLLVEWRPEPWTAHVVYTAELPGGAWGTVSEWVGAEKVRPVEP